MTRKSILFPVNNKGGVGKTSLLVDLMSMLSLDYRVGFLDMDGQRTLYGTLTGDYLQGSLDESVYTTIDTKLVEVVPGKEFKFAHGSKKIKIKIHPGQAPAALFPVGLIYDDPSTREKLEGIVQRDMADIGLIAVDLPTIPHAGLILDHSLMPVVQAAGGDVDLFPLVVVTPEKNTLDIGLSSFEMVRKYLTRQGVSESRIHPIVIVNKVAVDFDKEGKMAFGSLDDHDREKLRNLGIIFDDSVKDPSSYYFEFRKGFEFQGKRYKVQWMPYIRGLRTGDFHLLFSKKPELFNFPRLYQMALSAGFIDRREIPSEVERVYSAQMSGLSNFVRYHSHAQRARNYTVNKNSRPIAEAQTQIVGYIRTGLMDIDQMLSEGGKRLPKFYKIGNVAINHYSHGLSIWIPGQAIPMEALARAIAKAEIVLGLELGYILDTWRPGDYELILAALKAGDQFESYANELLSVGTPSPQYITKERIYIEMKLRDRSYERQRELFDAFLGHLDVELRKESRRPM